MSDATPKSGLRHALAPAAVGVAVFLLQLPVFDRWISLMDEGHLLQFADLVRRGGELYRDATLIAFPGAFYLLAGLFEWFEPSVRVARYAVSIGFALLVALSFAFLRRFVRPSALALAIALLLLYRIWAAPHWQMYSYSTTALTAIAAALVLLANHLTREESGGWRLALAGVVAGLAVACKQDYGGAAIVAFGALIVIAARTAPVDPRPRILRPLLVFNGAAMAVGVVMLGHYALAGLLPEMLRQTLWNHLVGIATFEYSSLPPLFPLFAQEPAIRSGTGVAVYVPSIVFSTDWARVSSSVLYRDTVVWDLLIKALFWGPYAYAGAALLRVAWLREALRDRSERERALREVALALLAALLVFTLHKPKDWVHVVVMYWPLVCLVAVHADALARARPRLARAAAWALALPFLALMVYSVHLAVRLADRFDTPLAAERAGGLRVTPGEAQVVGDALDYLREHSEPGSRVAVLPYFPLMNFLAERDAPHRSAYILWPLEEVPGRQQQIAAALDAAPGQPVLYHYTQWIQFPDMQQFAPDLFGHLVEHYAIDRVFSGQGWGYTFAALRREPAQQPGDPLLRDDLARAALSLRSDDGRDTRVAPDDRTRWARREIWPFRPVLALRPRSDGGETVLSTPLRVAPGMRLETAIAVHPHRWIEFPPSPSHFAVRIVDGDLRTEVFARSLDPHGKPDERGWFEVAIPLDAWTDREIRIEWVTATGRESSSVREKAGFAWPRVVRGATPVAGSPR